MEHAGPADSWSYQRLNAFKNRLDKLRKTKIGFFMDLSAKSGLSGVVCAAGEAIQGELQGEYKNPEQGPF